MDDNSSLENIFFTLAIHHKLGDRASSLQALGTILHECCSEGSQNLRLVDLKCVQ